MEKEKKSTKSRKMSINQKDIAKELAMKFGMNLSEIESILEEEAKIVMLYASKGYRIVRKNYMTIKPTQMPARKFVSPITKKEYDLPQSYRIIIIAGLGFKTLLNKNKKMPNKMCRFVS